MFFGNPNQVALEIGELRTDFEPGKIYVSIQFIIYGTPIGVWDDRLQLITVLRNMEDFLECREYRRNDSLRNVDSRTFFDRTWTAYYEGEYVVGEIGPNYRDRFHLSEIASDTIIDHYAIVVADVSGDRSRIVVKEFDSERIISFWTASSKPRNSMRCARSSSTGRTGYIGNSENETGDGLIQSRAGFSPPFRGSI